MNRVVAHPELVRVMEEGVRQGVFPGGVLLVGRRGEWAHRSAHGRRSLVPPASAVTLSTCFDLASLTKILATSSLAILLLQRGRLGLDDPVSRHLPGYSGSGREGITVAHLLEHSSGLVAWRPYYEEVAAAAGGSLLATAEGKAAIRQMVAAETPEGAPGTRALYSDLGFILLDWILERVGGKPSDVLFRDWVARPLGLSGLFFVDLKSTAKARRARQGRAFAATERCPWRGRTLVGEVHDDNTYAMGGVSGHAGLFGTAGDVARLAENWLAAYRGQKGLFEPAWVRRFWQKSQVPDSTRALGFDTRSPQDSQAGSKLSSHTVGHLGFTGTSLWIDLERSLLVVLLTNRVHPSRDNEAIKQFRPRLHDRVAEVFG